MEALVYVCFEENIAQFICRQSRHCLGRVPSRLYPWGWGYSTHFLISKAGVCAPRVSVSRILHAPSWLVQRSRGGWGDDLHEDPPSGQTGVGVSLRLRLGPSQVCSLVALVVLQVYDSLS